MATLAEFTCNPGDAKLTQILRALHNEPNVLVIFNHPLWDIHMERRDSSPWERAFRAQILEGPVAAAHQPDLAAAPKSARGILAYSSHPLVAALDFRDEATAAARPRPAVVPTQR